MKTFQSSFPSRGGLKKALFSNLVDIRDISDQFLRHLNRIKSRTSDERLRALETAHLFLKFVTRWYKVFLLSNLLPSM